MKSILIGSVGSSKVTLEEMINIGFSINMVFSLDEKYSTNVSGYFPLHQLAQKHSIPYMQFKNINEPENIQLIKEIEPDYIFVIGLSQLVGEDIINTAKKGIIGFHPTPLPKFRGRAAMVWQVLLGVRETKCTLFFVDKGMDSGDIIGQEDYVIDEQDYAEDVGRKCMESYKKLLRRVLPELMASTIKPIKQNEDEATYLLKRTPEDGLINWNEPIEKIQRLIRAVSKPYPGAFSNYDGIHKIIIWRADCLENKKYIGIPGQIAKVTSEYIDVVCIDGLLRIKEYDNVSNVTIIEGHKFK